MRPKRPFPEGSAEKLKLALKKARSKQEFQRIQCLWMRAGVGLSTRQIADSLGWHVCSVQRLHARYLREGEAALGPGRGGRRNEYLAPEHEIAILRRLEEEVRQGREMTFEIIRAALEAKIGRPMKTSTIYRMLVRNGWRGTTPPTAESLEALPSLLWVTADQLPKA
jgi:transposase